VSRLAVLVDDYPIARRYEGQCVSNASKKGNQENSRSVRSGTSRQVANCVLLGAEAHMTAYCNGKHEGLEALYLLPRGYLVAN